MGRRPEAKGTMPEASPGRWYLRVYCSKREIGAVRLSKLTAHRVDQGEMRWLEVGAARVAGAPGAEPVDGGRARQQLDRCGDGGRSGRARTPGCHRWH